MRHLYTVSRCRDLHTTYILIIWQVYKKICPLLELFSPVAEIYYLVLGGYSEGHKRVPREKNYFCQHCQIGGKLLYEYL